MIKWSLGNVRVLVWCAMVWSGTQRARMNWFSYILGLMGPLMIRMAYMPIYIGEI